MEKVRCEWVKSELSKLYHDREYGVRNHDDFYLFEMLVLETMQSGLSFEIVLRKRQAMREAFDNFDFLKIASYDDRKIKILMENKEIIRNKRKIEAMVNNAKAFIKIRQEFGSFDNYLKRFVESPIDYKREINESICESDLSEKISKDLKKRSFKFLGSITIHSFMEAVGLINNHNLSCFRHDEIKEK